MSRSCYFLLQKTLLCVKMNVHPLSCCSLTALGKPVHEGSYRCKLADIVHKVTSTYYTYTERQTQRRHVRLCANTNRAALCCVPLASKQEEALTCCSRWLISSSSSLSSLPLAPLPPVEEDTHSLKLSALSEIKDGGRLS